MRRTAKWKAVFATEFARVPGRSGPTRTVVGNPINWAHSVKAAIGRSSAVGPGRRSRTRRKASSEGSGGSWGFFFFSVLCEWRRALNLKRQALINALLALLTPRVGSPNGLTRFAGPGRGTVLTFVS